MPLPRPLLLALVGAVLAAAAFFATRGSSETSDFGSVDAAPEPAQLPDTPATSRPKATTDVRQALKGAPAVTSGTFALTISAKELDLTASGSFQSQGLARMPQFQMDVKGKTGSSSYDVGAVSTGDRGYLVRDEKALLVEAAGWEALSRARALQAKNGPKRGQGYSKAELGSMTLQGEERLAGAPVLHFRGAVDCKEARGDFDGFADLFDRTSLDSPLPGRLARSISGGTVDMWVGAQDHIVRRELYKFNSAAGPVELDYSRAALNEPQKISAPAEPATGTAAQAGWSRDEFGVAFSAFALAVFSIEPSAVEGPKPAKPKPAKPAKPKQAKPDKPARERKQGKPDRHAQRTHKQSRKQGPARRGATTPADVARAVRANRIVILFFRQGGADDDAVARAVSSVRGRRGVTVYTLPVGRAPKFGKFGGASVVRAPSVVLIDRDGDPRLFEGYIDSATLAQAVADAR